MDDSSVQRMVELSETGSTYELRTFMNAVRFNERVIDVVEAGDTVTVETPCFIGEHEKEITREDGETIRHAGVYDLKDDRISVCVEVSSVPDHVLKAVHDELQSCDEYASGESEHVTHTLMDSSKEGGERVGMGRDGSSEDTQRVGVIGRVSAVISQL